MKSYDKPAPPTDAVLRDAPRGLEFPDWNGMLPNRSRMTPEEAFQWNEEMLALFPPKLGRSRHADAVRNEAEFVL
jgi:hypothetical protein